LLGTETPGSTAQPGAASEEYRRLLLSTPFQSFNLGMSGNSRLIPPLLIFALADLSHPALARTYLNCTTREVVIVSGSSEGSSSTKETNMSF